MNKDILKACLDICKLMMLLTLSMSFLTLPVKADYLKGFVSEQEKLLDKNLGLSRKDLHKNMDPFSEPSLDKEEAILDAPPEAFQVKPPPKPAKPQKPFNLKATEQKFQGQPQQAMPSGIPFQGEPDNMPLAMSPLPPAMPLPPAFNSQDPENSEEMQLAWDAWHRRIAENIFTRFNFFARAAFKLSPPLLARVTYVVTRDGHIQNVQMLESSSNVLFNVLVFQSIKSLDGDVNLLQFPPGSRRQYVQKWGTFTQNYGSEGFRYTVGDKETLRSQ